MSLFKSQWVFPNGIYVWESCKKKKQKLYVFMCVSLSQERIGGEYKCRRRGVGVYGWKKEVEEEKIKESQQNKEHLSWQKPTGATIQTRLSVSVCACHVYHCCLLCMSETICLYDCALVQDTDPQFLERSLEGPPVDTWLQLFRGRAITIASVISSTCTLWRFALFLSGYFVPHQTC